MAGKKKILLADDVKYFIDLQLRLLKRTDCDVIVASDGNQVLELASKERPDLVIVDASLDKISGDECCKVIKSDPALKDIPVLLTVLESDKEEKERCLKSGCNDYVTKPIDKEVLLKKLKDHLNLIVREHVRVPVKISAAMNYNGTEYPCDIKDISEGGMSIVSDTSIPAKSSILLKFVMPNSDVAILALAEVVRVVEGQASSNKGYGVKFMKIPAIGKMIIAKAVGR